MLLSVRLSGDAHLPPPPASEASESLRTSALRNSKPSACVLLPRLAQGEAPACSPGAGMSAPSPCLDLLLTAVPHGNASSAGCFRLLSVPNLRRMLLASLLPPAAMPA